MNLGQASGPELRLPTNRAEFTCPANLPWRSLKVSCKGTIFLVMQIQGKVVIVTGGSNGIGRALCRKFAAAGARAVVIADIDREAGLKVAAEIKDTPGGFAHCNVASEKDVHNLVDSITDACGQV